MFYASRRVLAPPVNDISLNVCPAPFPPNDRKSDPVNEFQP